MTYQETLAVQDRFLKSLVESGRYHLVAAKSIGFAPDGKLCINAYTRREDYLSAIPDQFDGVTITKHVFLPI